MNIEALVPAAILIASGLHLVRLLMKKYHFPPDDDFSGGVRVYRSG